MYLTKQEKFSKSVGYLFISQGFIKVLGLAYSLYLINKPCFGDKGNAIYLSGYQIFAFMLTFCSIGVTGAVSNLIAKAENYYNLNKIFKVAIGLYIIISCICCLILYFFSDIIAKEFIGIKVVSYNLKVLAPMLIITTLESIYTGFFNGIKQMKNTAQIQFVEQLFKTFFTILLVEILSKKTSDPEILSIGATLSVAISIFVSFWICYVKKRNIPIYAKEISYNGLKSKSIIIDLLKFSIPVSVGAMLIGINKNSDSFVIMNILSEKIGMLEAQKIYGILASKVEVLIVLPLAFNITFSTALIPNISELKRKNDKKLVKFYVENAVFMSLAIGISAGLGLYFFSDEIFNLLFNNSKNGANLLKLASISIIFSVLNQTFTGILQGLEKNTKTVFAVLCGTISKVLLNILLVKQNCLLEKGIVISSILSNLIMCIILFVEIKKYIKFSFKRYLVALFFSGSVMIIIIKGLIGILPYFLVSSKISFVISAFVGAIIFVQECLIFGRIFGFLKIRKN